MRWTLHPATAFGEHRALWDEANQLGGRHPLLDSVFVGGLLECFGSPSVRLALLTGAGGPAAALVVPAGRGAWETFQPSQAPVGLVLLPDRSAAPAQLRSLLRAVPGYGLALSVFQQDPDMSGLGRGPSLPDAQHLDYIQTARLSIRSTWDEYWKSRSRNLVHNLSRQRRRLREQGARLELVVDREPGRMAEAVGIYADLESRGWKSSEGTAVTVDNVQGRFYRQTLERFCAQGEGLVYRLLLDGRTVAVDLCVERNGVLMLLKTTYDEQVNGLSLGLLLHQEIFEAAFTEGRVKTIEFYGRVREWHTKWTDEIRSMYHLTLYRHAWVGRMYHAVRAWRSHVA